MKPSGPWRTSRTRAPMSSASWRTALPLLSNAMRRRSLLARPPLNRLPRHCGKAEPVYQARPEGAGDGALLV